MSERVSELEAEGVVVRWNQSVRPSVTVPSWRGWIEWRQTAGIGGGGSKAATAMHLYTYMYIELRTML